MNVRHNVEKKSTESKSVILSVKTTNSPVSKLKVKQISILCVFLSNSLVQVILQAVRSIIKDALFVRTHKANCSRQLKPLLEREQYDNSCHHLDDFTRINFQIQRQWLTKFIRSENKKEECIVLKFAYQRQLFISYFITVKTN